jgi:tetratricopeptide (TPR) repeat protein
MQVKQAAVKHYEEGKMLHQKGKLASAERAYKKAIKISQNFVEPHYMLGNLLFEGGRFKEAFNEYRKALKLAPNHPTLLNNMGNLFQQQGENEKALSWLEKAASQDPANAVVQSNLGNALWSVGKEVEAVAAYKRAIELNPDLADAHRNLGGILVELGDLDEAVNCFNQALRINPGDQKSCQGLGRAQSERGDMDQAVSAYQQAIALDPANAEYHRELGLVFSDHGEIEKAVSAHRKALEINPGDAQAYRSLSKNMKFTEYGDDMKAMESLLAKKGIPDEDSIQLAFALGKAYEDLGDFDKSMEFVIKATGLERNSHGYSIARSQEQFDRIKQVFSPDFFSEHHDSGDPDRTPVFILGMPRSGSSLVEQILASHPDVYGAGELNDLVKVFESISKPVGKKQSDTFPQGLLELDSGAFADLGKQYISRIRRYSADAKFITDKMPHNFLRIGFIRTILPNARVIHCTRDPMDNCLSIFKTYLPNGHRYSYDMSELGQYYKMYLDLMDYWRDTLPGFIYDQSYEELVSSPQEQVSKLLQHCGLDWNDACLDFHKTRRAVKTPSNAQVRRPIYNDSVQLWKRYEEQLEPLRAAIYD